MTQLFDELIQQPQALQNLVAHYQGSNLLTNIIESVGNKSWVVTGMGASYHAASIFAFHLNSLGIEATSVEAIDVINYHKFQKEGHFFVYISQSGESGEVLPFFERVARKSDVLGITNHPNSTLGTLSRWTLPLIAGDEKLIASKTYINSLALLWVIARKATLVEDGSEWTKLLNLSDRVKDILEQEREIKASWVDELCECKSLVFLGHGPHAITARQAAMTLSEWSKIPTLYSGIGAFRHGFIETAQTGMGAVFFLPRCYTSESGRNLALELREYGVKELFVINGSVGKMTETEVLDEFLSPILDIIPVQLFADEMSVRLKIPSGFRYLNKVVTKL